MILAVPVNAYGPRPPQASELAPSARVVVAQPRNAPVILGSYRAAGVVPSAVGVLLGPLAPAQGPCAFALGPSLQPGAAGFVLAQAFGADGSELVATLTVTTADAVACGAEVYAPGVTVGARRVWELRRVVQTSAARLVGVPRALTTRAALVSLAMWGELGAPGSSDPLTVDGAELVGERGRIALPSWTTLEAIPYPGPATAAAVLLVEVSEGTFYAYPYA